MRFRCDTCGRVHDGTAGIGFSAPAYYESLPEAERGARCQLDADTCILDNAHFFVRGCLEVPVEGQSEPFIWGVWVTLSARNFARFRELLAVPRRAHEGPWFGWFSNRIQGYPDTLNLKAKVLLRDGNERPLIELEHTEHLFAREQRSGITMERVRELLQFVLHPPNTPAA
jgi:hypothetical protein